MRRLRRWLKGCFIVTCALSLGAWNAAPTHGQTDDAFDYIFPVEGVAGYPAAEMVINCGGEYPRARARLWMNQRNGRTHVLISVRNAPPNAIFTVWLKLAAPSPLTGAGVTALANPDQIGHLASVTPDSVLTTIAHDLGLAGDDGSGGLDVANGFLTDDKGHGFFYARLNFPVIKGAYQFQEFHEMLAPVAIDNAPFTLRLATHCADGVAHGLVAGKHEMFFDWKYPEN